MFASQSLQERIDKAVKEEIAIVPYNSKWPQLFENEARFLSGKFPLVIKRIEHFGSTAVVNLAAKPIIDMLVEVTSYKDVKAKIVPVLTELGYDYFWRPEFDKPPMYAWFIKRDKNGQRTHHIHMITKDSKMWDRLLFRDYLRTHAEQVNYYGDLKLGLAARFRNDRVAYTKAKTEFVREITELARKK
ncbi:MAG: GrpB family protein [Patescibacteria group bacterium]|jgi:GrpB-like predicted nucleotidyltransferase (UPF0157 family)